MEEKSRIDNGLENGPNSSQCIKSESSDGEVKDVTINKALEGIKAVNSVAESSDSIKDEDIAKTVTFSENIEIFNPILKTTIAIKINLDLPLNLTGQHSHDHFKKDGVHSDVDESSIQDIESMQSIVESVQSIESDLSDAFDSIAGEEYPIQFQMEFDTEKSAELRKWLPSNLIETSTNLENAETFQTQKKDDNDDLSAGIEPKIIHLNDGHKEFRVQNVDESQLILDHEHVNAKLATQNRQFDDACIELQRAPSNLSNGLPPNTDINYQDTIGPLDNPAFLRKLHYSVSRQPTVIQDELSVLRSNFDIRSLSVLQDPPDLDKGWAWVVLAAGFTANALLGATIYASGVLMLAILTEINPDLTKVAWVGSLFVCSMCLSGPFVDVVITQFSTRTTVFFASIILSAGFIGASFATNISVLILTHGLIAGLGAGFIINPISVSVGQYFLQYRGLACGLMATGAGAGMLTGGTIISLLLDQYGLGGTYLIWAGVLLHTAILGLLLRPSPEQRLRALEREAAVKERHQHYSNQPDAPTGPSSLLGSVNQSMMSGIDKIGYGKKTTLAKNFVHINSGELQEPLLKDSHNHDLPSTMHKVATNQIFPSSNALNQHHKFHQNFVLEDVQLISSSKTPLDTPKTNSHYNVPLSSQYILANNVSNFLYYESATTNVLSSTSKNTYDWDKINQKEICLEPSAFGKIIYVDQDIPLVKPTLHLDLQQAVVINQTLPISHGNSPILHSKANQSFGDQQYTSLFTSPSAMSKSNSPPTISLSSRHTLTNNMHTSSSSQENIHIDVAPDLSHLSFTPNSPSHSPVSIPGPQAGNKIPRRRLSHSSLSQYTSLSHSSLRLSLRGSLHPSRAGEIDNESLTSTFVSQIRVRDGPTHKYQIGSKSFSTLVGSVSSIPIALAIVKDDVSRYETFSAVTVDAHEKGLKRLGINILDSMRLLKQKSFVTFLSVSFLWSLGESPVMIYLPSFAISQGTSPLLASILYTSMGAGSITGRFLSGLTATDKNIGPFNLYIGCLGVAGLLIALSPLFTTTFFGQIVFSSLVGIYTGCLVPLSSLVVIDMLDIGELGMGFGFISMAQGIGYLIGPPLASVIVTAIGYGNSFVFSGCVLMFGSLITLGMSACKVNNQEDEQEIQDQFHKSDLEKITENVQGEEHAVNTLSTINEVKEIPKAVQVVTVLVESSREASKSHEHFANEEKLDTIIELP